MRRHILKALLNSSYPKHCLSASILEILAGFRLAADLAAIIEDKGGLFLFSKAVPKLDRPVPIL